VLDEEYAVEIASKWNPTDRDSGFSGWVTRFRVEDPYAQRYRVETVGARRHRELWVPAAELGNFNAHLQGPIEVVHGFVGPGFASTFAGVLPALPVGRLSPSAVAQVVRELEAAAVVHPRQS